MELCIKHGGEVRERQQTLVLGDIYKNLSEAGRKKFLHFLAVVYDRDHDNIRKHAEALAKRGAQEDYSANETELKNALIAPRTKILRQFLSLPEGHGFLEGMRDDLAKMGATDPVIKGLESDLQDILSGVVISGPQKEMQQAKTLRAAYEQTPEADRKAFFERLASSFDRDHETILAQARKLLQASDPADIRARENALKDALLTPRAEVLRQILVQPDEGYRTLVNMRGDLRKLRSSSPALRALEGELKEILSHVFDVGLLELKRITNDFPDAVIQKIFEYERVHALKSAADVRALLARDDRRIYAFFNPDMPEEPLITLNVRLAKKIESSIQKIRDASQPVVEPKEATTALFDAISNGPAGLDGISFGNSIIKRVVGEIKEELPNVKQFSTVSPIQEFRKWLERKLEAGDVSLLLPNESTDIKKLMGENYQDAAHGLLHLLESGKWKVDRAHAGKLEPIMKRLAARYLLLEEKDGSPEPLDPVARFHLKNGAQVERINWQGDNSDAGMKRSWGMTVNYLYNLRHIDANHEKYSQGHVTASPEVRALALLGAGQGRGANGR